MDENNPFLNSYKAKLAEDPEGQEKEKPAAVKAAAPLHFEEKSDFVRIAPDFAKPPARRVSKKVVALIVWAAVILVVAVALIWYFSRGVEAADLKDWTLSDAQLWAGDNNIKLQVEEEYNDQYDAGRIIKQDPAAGTRLKSGSFLKVTVSLGHNLTVALPLPDLMSMTMTEIEAWAAENFMTKVRITTEFSDTVKSGDVISFEINDNTVVDKVKRNTPIYVIVSKGKEDQVTEPVTVPDFKQMTISQCYEFADEKGIVLKVAEAFDDYVPSGSIISQSAKAESKVNKGDTITLTVSKGKKIIMPSFSEYSKQAASALASEMGITATTLDRYSSKKAGDFIKQSIEVGTIYTAGEVLELTYSLGNKIVLSSFVGQTRDSIEAWAKELNDQGASITIKATYTQSDAPKDQIIYQDKANLSIGVVSTIRITVSLGKIVFVPDFVTPEGFGYDLAITREKALALCAEAGIIPIFVAEDKAGRLPGEIWYQSVAAGTEVYQGTTISLKYKPANATICVPDFTGMTQAEILAAGYMKQLNIAFVLADTFVDGYGGKVYQQSILANTTVAYGTAITLTVSPESP